MGETEQRAESGEQTALGSIGLESTWFKSRWAEYAQNRRLEHLSELPLSVAELRRDALEFFSWGCVHQAVAQQRLEELLPEAGGREQGAGSGEP